MNSHSRRQSAGFTIIELLIVIVVVAVAGSLFFYQKNNLQTANQDEKRKIAVNAMYYNLEEVFYPKNNYYPQTLNERVLTAMDPALLTDTNGYKIDEVVDASELGGSATQQVSEYRYEPTNCDSEGKCKSYTLRVTLVNEAEYIKKSRHQ
ncbi:hypothetical protein A2707_03045 [Candidatus Saccharibacteria bacterium RIFCSPHIGHO2_01_FULL_45_15]|nr:MAG: hypothetical protein A2707_03045 [Candidatus Saccharibacteria bacterium RIFCSPHIGHO2_01_FULL_45_15]OGL28483.1 MAG: hypothetical protein A3C39_03015 [Candidatus Saccharibacteria bacterium RIFCSPHIGHO2_02_FULL_46_12]OGL32521.1 MAG: hypothetical protein A3E76_00525 [Candidatus Saccharibacteria bacterium RIFCSPHIGHO2_12_FULL_44_22]